MGAGVMDRAFPFVIAVTRGWTRLYTHGLPPAVAACRRDEIDSDVWEMCHDDDAGTLTRRLRIAVCRLVGGMVDDLRWRMDHASLAEISFARRAVAFALATLVVGSLLALPAWRFGGGRRVATCAATTGQPATTAHLRHDVIRCAGAFFTGPR